MCNTYIMINTHHYIRIFTHFEKMIHTYSMFIINSYRSETLRNDQVTFQPSWNFFWKYQLGLHIIQEFIDVFVVLFCFLFFVLFCFVLFCLFFFSLIFVSFCSSVFFYFVCMINAIDFYVCFSILLFTLWHFYLNAC